MRERSVTGLSENVRSTHLIGKVVNVVRNQEDSL